MKRLLYGSAFDPIHDGHLGMLAQAQEQCGIDEVVLIPTKNPRWKSTSTPIEHRLAMVAKAIENKPNWRISRQEIDTPTVVQFTIDTVRAFKEQAPEDDLYYLIGADQVEQFHKWKEAEELASLVQLVAYPRPGMELHHPNYHLFHIQLLEGPSFSAASREIRALKQLQTPLPVVEYILDHDLYFTKTLKAYYSEKRFAHVYSTAKVAYRIAQANHLRADHAFQAAILHDMAKDLSDDVALDLIQQYETHKGPFEPYVLHQFAGAILARNEFHIEEPSILDAIRFHTTGNADLHPLAKVIYASDKIEPLRGYDSSSLMKACEKNIDDGFIAVLKDNMRHLKKKAFKWDHPLVQACLHHYLGETYE
jgi:nicotinate-nucleotide adenylyltransferase